MFTDFIKGTEKGHFLNFYLSSEVDFGVEYTEIRVKNVRVYLDLVSTKLSIKLEHLGNSLIVLRNNDRFDFC